MKKIVVVDDEIRQCRGLKNILQRHYADLEIQAFTSASEALAHIEAEGSRIVITDICMPEMDGLELTEAIRRIDGSIKVILLTGYAEFEYARKAVGVGAFDYLLKPLNTDKLKEVLERAEKELNEEEVLSEQRKKLQRQLDMTLPVYMEKLLNQWVYGFASLKERAEIEKVIPSGMDGFVIATSIPGLARIQAALEPPAAEEMKNNLVWWMRKLIRHPWHSISFFGNVRTDTMVTIVSRHRGGVETQCRNFSGLLRHSLVGIEAEAKETFPGEKLGLAGYRMAVGNLHVDLLHSIEGCYKSAAEVLEYFFYFPEVSVLWAEFILAHRITQTEISLTEEGVLRDAVKEGNGEKAENAFLAILDRCLAGGYPEPIHLKYSFENLLNHTALFFRSERKFKYRVERPGEDSSEEFIRQAGSYLRALAEETGGGKKERNAGFAIRLEEYLNGHYSEDVSLDDLAAYFHVTPTYCSALVKEATGSNFSKMLLQMRIRKAKELLGETDMRIYQIAEQTGYSDVKYFNRIFKRETGVTPVQYREEFQRIGGSDE